MLCVRLLLVHNFAGEDFSILNIYVCFIVCGGVGIRGSKGGEIVVLLGSWGDRGKGGLWETYSTMLLGLLVQR